MRPTLFSILLFSICLFATSTAKQSDNTSQTETRQDSIVTAEVPKALLDIARLTKFIYTKNAQFTFEQTDTEINGENIRQVIPR